MSTGLRPPFSYYGGKTRLGPAIARMLPAHTHYVEPFAGSLAVLLAKRPAAHETVNDLDGDIVLFWKVLREQPDELARVCAHTPHSRLEWAAAYDRPDGLSDLERARRVWVLLSQGRTGTLLPSGWRFYIDPRRTNTAMPGYLRAYVERMADVAERMQRVSLECRPALEVIDAYGQMPPEVLLYVDPPYLGSARNSVNYRHEMTSDAQHAELAEALHRATATVIVSGYPSPLYDEQLYADWHRLAMSASTQQGGTGEAAERVEVLWSNRPLAGELALF